jgi:predicted metal-binding protein
MKIAILVRQDILNSCTAKGCLNAFNNKIDSFYSYDEDTELVGFTIEGGELEYKIKKLIKNGVEAIHLSSCMRSKSENYEALAELLSNYFHVIGYTHGSNEGKRRNTITLKKNV